MKIAVLGERDFATGFRLAGIKTVYEVSDADFVQRFEECFSVEGIGIIIMDEKYFKKLPSRFKKKIEKAVSPVVVSVSETNVGGADIAELIRRSLGVDLWKE